MHSWVTNAARQLAECQTWTYAAAPVVASEPTALAALALIAHGQAAAVQPLLDWLFRQQNSDGSVGVTAEQATPGWPTSLAVLAWNAAEKALETSRYRANCQRGIDWLLATAGTTVPQAAYVGHDTMILGWPWVVGTHAWIEPTAFALLALQSQGLKDHPRAISAGQLLVDRMLPQGGCNYGNTVVLGQEVLPHLQPTGIALLATSREATDPRVAHSLDYLQQNLPACTSPASLGYGLLGLSAHVGKVDGSEAWLAKSYAATTRRGLNAFALALLLLAAKAAERPFQIQESEIFATQS